MWNLGCCTRKLRKKYNWNAMCSWPDLHFGAIKAREVALGSGTAIPAVWEWRSTMWALNYIKRLFKVTRGVWNINNEVRQTERSRSSQMYRFSLLELFDRSGHCGLEAGVGSRGQSQRTEVSKFLDIFSCLPCCMCWWLSGLFRTAVTIWLFTHH